MGKAFEGSAENDSLLWERCVSEKEVEKEGKREGNLKNGAVLFQHIEGASLCPWAAYVAASVMILPAYAFWRFFFTDLKRQAALLCLTEAVQQFDNILNVFRV